MRLHYRRPWFLQRTLRHLHPHDYKKRELADAWFLDLEDRVSQITAILPIFLPLAL